MTYYRPRTVQRAVKLLQETKARVVSGGTDLVVRMEKGMVESEHFVDISYLELNHISISGDTVTIGSGVTMATLATHPVITGHLPILAMAARDVAAPQIRTRATIGGNIVNASPAADGVCGLSVHDPLFTVVGPSGSRQIAFQDFFKSPGRTAMNPEEILTEINISTALPQGAVRELTHWFKHGNRLAQVISVVAFAGRTFLDANGTVVSARYGVASVAPVPYRVRDAEALIQGKVLNSQVAGEIAEAVGKSVTPIDDLRGSASYRRHIAAIMAKRHLTDFADGRGTNLKSTESKNIAPPQCPEEGAITFTLNGEAVTYPGDQSLRLLDVLRDHFGLTGTKNGCGEGECGACTVLVDGEPVNACMVLAGNAAGRSVTTIEGITAPKGVPGLVQQAFVDAGAVQCGFCIPGFEMSAHHFIQNHTSASDLEIREAISGNLCRCTGYMKIIEAVELAMERKGKVNL
ncbi:FAD binding domain-containing protein [Myxococcota bacterium]|nr:FAD binding domain-containing protein [Myxococcota bacterium]MBU1537960.1 FAD binding domain-containing protein [Myxococcota bacterium]